MSHYKPYPVYKESGAEWIGKVPEHWLIGRLGDSCMSISTGTFGTALGANDYIEDGIPVINPSHRLDCK
jgi:type I restriction enzyme S subunit